MSALNWAIDFSQSTAIGTLEEKVELLEKDMATARAWIEYLNKRIEELENQNGTD
jgi:chaperonin cofactor prefoldin